MLSLWQKHLRENWFTHANAFFLWFERIQVFIEILQSVYQYRNIYTKSFTLITCKFDDPKWSSYISCMLEVRVQLSRINCYASLYKL